MIFQKCLLRKLKQIKCDDGQGISYLRQMQNFSIFLVFYVNLPNKKQIKSLNIASK